MSHSNAGDDHDRWARLRFAVVGPLLASPPPQGRLRTELERLSQRDWEHPSFLSIGQRSRAVRSSSGRSP